jgi:tetratricopeptide (TPR) repeat protein
MGNHGLAGHALGEGTGGVDRWDLAHGHIGVNAPSWLTFEVHRPYFDGADSPRATLHARGSLLAARRFRQRQPTALRFGMTMPGSYRRLLMDESRLHDYDVRDPTGLPRELASEDWCVLADAFSRKADLDDIDRAGLAHWLAALCLHESVLDVVAADLPQADCADPVAATIQWARATALFAVEGLSPRTVAAYRCLAENPLPTVAHVQAVAGWGYVLSRHAGDDSAAPRNFATAGDLLKSLAADMCEFDHTILRARLMLREVMYAEREQDFHHAWNLLCSASGLVAGLRPATADEESLAVEMRRRLIDRRVDIAVRRGDEAAAGQGVAEGLALDPFDVRLHMQAAQADERRGDRERALAGFLQAARLGPFGTAFALLGALRCAKSLGHEEFARVLAERAFRAAPRSARTRDTLVDICASSGDEPLAEVVRRAAGRDRARPYENNWHYQMYASYFNLGESRSPCLYSRLPTLAYEFAERGAPPEVNWQRLMPPRFRANLVRESGLRAFAVSHPAQLPAELRTPAWDRLCRWVAGFDESDRLRQYLTAQVLFRLGFGELVLTLLHARPVADLRDPLELRIAHWRDVVRYVGSVAGPVAPPTASFEVADSPHCPAQLRFVIAVFAVVFHARETRSIDDVLAWRAKAQRALDELLDTGGHSPFERAMMESRFYRSVTFAPFMLREREQLRREMDRAEELARAAPASTPYEEFLSRENLRACLESRSKEAFAFGAADRGHRLVLEVLQLDPYEPKTHLELAETLMRQGDELESGNSYLRTARLGPIGTARGYALAGERFERAGQPLLAEDCYVQALRVDPYAVSAARGWRRVATGMSELATDYAGALEAWGAARMAARSA